MLTLTAAAGLIFVVGATRGSTAPRARVVLSPNVSGKEGTLTLGRSIDRSGPFFQALGTNDRSCATCHDPAAGWSVAPPLIQARFEASGGLDPLFRRHDGANAPTGDFSTVEARQSAYSMLLSKGLFRIGMSVPTGAEFEVAEAEDPYGYATPGELSLFRRPLPATNLRFLTTVMWDGRETRTGSTLEQDLTFQALNATLGHGQAPGPMDAATLQAIVRFELAQTSAQAVDTKAGPLNQGQGRGGPVALARQAFSPGVNDPLSPGFDPEAFTLFRRWMRFPNRPARSRPALRKAVARGERLFNTREFNIRDTPGFNDVAEAQIFRGTCSTCHNVPNVGNHSIPRLMNIGVGTLILGRTPDEPWYTLRNIATGEMEATQDPGAALVTGKWADIGKFKVPGLRGLAARAPYFHNGAASDLAQVVDFYDRRYGVGFRPDEAEDLIAFLRSL